MNLSPGAAEIIARLEQAGFEAYLVGGCVRDQLLGNVPHDWDLCTSALPEEIKACMFPLPVIETGIHHGTVTVLLENIPYEVTTFRTEGAYTDHRRPDTVQFVKSLQEDLRRRDFTINAMAYAPRTGLQDPFGGQRDLAAGLLRCVGDPQQRFQEDALRILRALRFSSVLGLTLCTETERAVRALAPTLSAVSSERIYQEFCKLLSGPNAPEILLRYPDVLGVFLPEILPAVGFSQHSPWHSFDVWRHTVTALSHSPKEDQILRWALLFHDLGKPASFSLDEHGTGHFYGHDSISAHLAQQALERLRAQRSLTDSVCALIRRHSQPLSCHAPTLLRLLRRLGEQQTRRLFLLQRCDVSAQNPATAAKRLEQLTAVEQLLDQLLAEQRCFSQKDLAVSGRDLLALGLSPGPRVGALLQTLLDSVMDGVLPNEHAILLSAAAQKIKEEEKNL